MTPVAWMAVAFEVDGRPSQFFSVATGKTAGDAPPPGAQIVDGRAADPRVAGEVTINEEARRQTGADVGERITLRSYASDQFEAFIGSDIEEDRGPRVEVVVTGIHRSAEDISDNPEATVLLTPAFHDEYGDQIVHCDCSFWIAASRSDADAIAAALPAVIGDYPLAVQEVDGPVRTRVDRSVALEVGALQIAALVAAVRVDTRDLPSAGPPRQRHWIDQPGTRSHRRNTTPGRSGLDGHPAPGRMRRRARRGRPATALSPLFPRGLARRAEIDTGIRFDTITFIGGGLVLLVVTVGLAITYAAAVATGRQRSATVRRFTSGGHRSVPPQRSERALRWSPHVTGRGSSPSAPSVGSPSPSEVPWRWPWSTDRPPRS